MKGILSILVVAALAVSCQQAKFAHVDYAKLMDGYKRKQDLESSYQLKAETFNRKRDSISQAFQLEAQDVQNRSRNSSQQRAQEEMTSLQQRAQLVGQQLQQEEQQMQRMGQMKSDSLLTQVKETIAKYGTDNGYTYVFAAGEGSSVLYGQESLDVTEAILKILNDEYQK
ncbi:OmpH family outer membrane protein [Robiginitalea sp. M366]|uniref:OmpH family outer membrane protein n=1 Tax=Robiginitalea aestuariiviva TaxID=3036903 RepID=UPI00240D6EA2|nr:OmpH family outer membrane protein [Robiginitalea aestuariiviva]MDG1571498.1 OmpH family outer membrane protein [Robiginitalea aestuariiviva]